MTGAQSKGRGVTVVALNSGLWSAEKHSFLGQHMDEYSQDGRYFINHVNTEWHFNLWCRQAFVDKGFCTYIWGKTNSCTLLTLKHCLFLHFTLFSHGLELPC